MTSSFIDSGSIHSAIAALIYCVDERTGDWDRQSLLDATYLITFDDVRLAPGIQAGERASGYFEQVVARVPALEAAHDEETKTQAFEKTVAWLTDSPEQLAAAWEQLITHDEDAFIKWTRANRDFFWIPHIQMQKSMFQPQFIPHLSKLLNVSERDLERLELASQKEGLVGEWSKDLGNSDGILAELAYVAASLIRGRYHEYMAGARQTHLVAHPFRSFIAQRPSVENQTHEVPMSEERLAKAIIGSALLEPTPERRVMAWVDSVAKIREAVTEKGLQLSDSSRASVAQESAESAFIACGIAASPTLVRRAVNFADNCGFPQLRNISVSAWNSSFAGRAIGFKRLIEMVPGRVSRLPGPSRSSSRS